MQALLEACTDPVTLKFESMLKLTVTFTVFVCTYDSIVPENDPDSG